LPHERNGTVSLDPVVTNPDYYKVVFENDRVRVLEYTDQPGDRTTPHEHPDSVMYTLSSFRRRLYSGGDQRDVEISAGMTGWLPAQQHSGHNIGDTTTHVIFVELMDPAARSAAAGLGPSGPAVE
jgi:quercetin dioxygenase-like cupin family protein